MQPSLLESTIRSEERRVGKEGRYWRDWSSDVCSSDLACIGTLRIGQAPFRRRLIIHFLHSSRSIAHTSQRINSVAPNIFVKGVRAMPPILANIYDAAIVIGKHDKIGRASCRERG